jgi:hypothetical protein
MFPSDGKTNAYVAGCLPVQSSQPLQVGRQQSPSKISPRPPIRNVCQDPENYPLPPLRWDSIPPAHLIRSGSGGAIGLIALQYLQVQHDPVVRKSVQTCQLLLLLTDPAVSPPRITQPRQPPEYNHVKMLFSYLQDKLETIFCALTNGASLDLGERRTNVREPSD